MLCDFNIAAAQTELSRNKCRPQRIDIWQQAVDTDVFNPAFRSQEMRARMSGGKPDSVILTYVGRLGAGRGIARRVPIPSYKSILSISCTLWPKACVSAS